MSKDDKLPGTGPALGDGTLVQVKLWHVGAIIIAIFTGATTMTMAWVNLTGKVDDLGKDRWTAQDQREWAHRLDSEFKQSTVKILIPDPDAVRRDIRTP